MGFTPFNLDPKITAGIRALGYTTPTPIQEQSIPPILKGRDLLGLAQTGTGKTAAFALPILQRLMQGPRGRTRALILAPTRELADQIQEFFRALGRQTGLRSLTVYGGVSAGVQVSTMRKGVEIIIACPGRLLDHLERGTFNPSSLEVLVLDEADRMFDMGFLPGIRKILQRLPAKRQTLLFSATMPNDIRSLAHDILKDPVTVQVNHTEALTTVSHSLYPVPEHLKSELLSRLLKQTGEGSVLVFMRTKHRVKRLAQKLKGQGLSVTSLQGNLSQSQRKASLDGFRGGRFNILIATDIASRGIDISQITHVINYDIPDTTEAYTHRIGRTGRAAKTGDAFTFVTRENESMVREIERAMKVKIVRRIVEGFNYGAHPEPQAPQNHHAPHAQHGSRPHAPAAHNGSGFRGSFERHRPRRAH